MSLISLKWATKKHSLHATSEVDPNKEFTYRKSLQSYSEIDSLEIICSCNISKLVRLYSAGANP